ncbi:MAG TPA: hypothetical protein VNV86_00950, partial [Candidatus Acidoferrum sp.]|nr:hypothetical protein [Candidatus Acidoferrum sp.]
RDGGRRPVIAVSADVGIHIKVVEQHELSRQLVVIASPACANCAMGGDRTTRADIVPGVSPSVNNQGAQAWFNAAAFVPQTTPYGTVGRSTIWAPGLQQWDLGFAKRFRVAEQKSFQFRGELFNVFNQVNLKPPASSAGSAGFGALTAALPGRNVQFGLKFYW